MSEAANGKEASRLELGTPKAIAIESARIESRREYTDTKDHPALPGKRWALALSGGGIRSATFALGVLQGLATHGFVRGGTASAQPGAEPKPWLRFFDYLSTVSGGGYIGAFFCSLFVPGRLMAGKGAKDPATAADAAFAALQYDPPSRARHTSYAAGSTPGEMALAWLRNNGRYLAPTGSGDVFYAGAVHVRNWVSLHFVIGSLILALFASLGALRLGLATTGAWGCLERWLLPDGKCSGFCFWPSSFFILPIVLLVPLFIVGFAYWLAHPDRGHGPTEKSNPLSLAALSNYLIAAVTFAGAYFSQGRLETWARVMLAVIGTLCLVSALLHAILSRRRTVDAERSRVTAQFARMARWVVVLLAIALLDSLGQSVYLWLERNASIWTVSGPPALLASAIWLVRKLAHLFDASAPAKGMLAKLPVSVIAGAVALVMFLLLAVFWQLIVQVVMWHAHAPTVDAIGKPYVWKSAGMLAFIAVSLAFAMGQFPGFINLSTLARFYGARLTRAYLGSSNGKRFADDASARKWVSAAEPHPDDDLTHEQYYPEKSSAPVHIINVTVNQTTDDGDQLVQRDRKGRPMSILPGGFSIDESFYRFAKPANGRENELPLTIGQWVSTSGAAFTTGLGRQTSLGISLACGLANVRLGTWWSTGVGVDRSSGFEAALLRPFKSQTYLGYECLAQFHGLCRPWQYLSDGGHFENTAVYPLLHRDRGINVIVVCDDGADPNYQFEDLGNLIRLARIDYRIEIEVEEGVFQDPVLSKVFGRPENFREEAKASKRAKCALFLRAVGYDDQGQENYRCAIIVLKPTLIDDAPEDVLQYGLANGAFPQQPTADQFFDEAQWESYRKLGRVVAHQVFGETRCGPALVSYLTAKRYIS